VPSESDWIFAKANLTPHPCLTPRPLPPPPKRSAPRRHTTYNPPADTTQHASCSTQHSEMDAPPVAPPPPPVPASPPPDLGVSYYQSGRYWYEMTKAERAEVLQAISKKNKALSAAWQRAVDTLPAVEPGRSCPPRHPTYFSGARVKAWCLHIHAEASLSAPNVL
jgi:hypothetical protein